MWRADRRSTIIIIVSQIVQAVALAVQILALRNLITALEAEPTESVAGPAIMLMLAIAASAAANVVVRETRLLAGEKVQREATIATLSAAARIPLGAYEQPELQDLLTRATSNLGPRLLTTIRALVTTTTSLSGIISLSIVLAALAPTVFVISLLSAGPALAVTRRNSRALYMFNYFHTGHDRRRLALERTILERRTAAELRSLGSASTLIDRVEHLFADRIDRISAISRRRLLWSLGGAAVGLALAAIALAVLINRVTSGQLPLADGLVALVALQQLTTRARSLSLIAAELDEAGLYLDDFRQFMDRANSVAAEHEGSRQAVANVSIKNVSFTYPGTEEVVLHDVSLPLDTGRVVALVGENGSGKSTLAKLAAGLYAPGTGSVTWGGSQLALDDLRASCAFVFQDFARFPLSVSDNVSLGRPGADASAIGTALDDAGMTERVKALPHGIESILARELDNGVELSGGEWQRIALARAFHSDRPLLVLDEASSALDPIREAELVETMRRLGADRAVLYISHRFSTVRSADLIGVMQEGRLSELGSHDELMALDGHYAHLFRLQAASYT